jgi:hypothetical protein
MANRGVVACSAALGNGWDTPPPIRNRSPAATPGAALPIAAELKNGGDGATGEAVTDRLADP